MLRAIFAFLDFFVSEEATSKQLALSAVLGMFLGFIPVLTLQWCFLFAAALLLRFNLATVFFSALFFSAVALIVDPIFTKVGLHFLTHIKALLPIWAWMHHALIIPYTRFNNTYVFGSTLLCIISAIPFFFIMHFLVIHCREGIYHFWKTTRLSRHYAHFKRYI